jgi:hypothetical protein
MIVRAEGGRAILTTHEIPDMVIREGFPKTLPEKLHMTLLEAKRLHRLSGLRISIPMTGYMFFVIGQSQEVSGIVILKFHHTAISPITGTGYAAAFTLAAGNFNPVKPGLFSVSGNLGNI